MICEIDQQTDELAYLWLIVVALVDLYHTPVLQKRQQKTERRHFQIQAPRSMAVALYWGATAIQKNGNENRIGGSNVRDAFSDVCRK